MEVFTIDNFLNDNDIKDINDLPGTEEPFHDIQGVYKGAITSTQQWIEPLSSFTEYLKKKLFTIPYLKNKVIDAIQILRAQKPYDVHSDWIVTNNQIQLIDPNINPPAYTIVIPIVAGEYSTVVFEQGATFNNFSEYKKDNTILEKYCSNDDWQKYCSHCDTEDQKYLTIKKIFNWKQGSLFAFDRKLFHCSSNFGEASKKAIVMWLSKKKD